METLNQELVFEFYHPRHQAALATALQCLDAEREMPFATVAEIHRLSADYPPGQMICRLGEQIVGAVIARIVDFQSCCPLLPLTTQPNASCLPQAGMIGDAVEIIDIFVLAQYQNLKIGKRLFERVLQGAFTHNVQHLIGRSPVTGYLAYMHEMDRATYVQKVKYGEILDPVLGFHLSNGADLVKADPHFLPIDPLADSFSFLLSIPNLSYNPAMTSVLALPQHPLQGNQPFEQVA